MPPLAVSYLNPCANLLPFSNALNPWSASFTLSECMYVPFVAEPLLMVYQDKISYIRARFYGKCNRPTWKLVQTQITSKRRRSTTHSSRRYPWVEGIFEHHRIQPFIHDTFITVRQNGTENIYHIFCQNHCRLPSNNSVRGVWRGDIIVMREGKDICGVVDMRPQDAGLVDQVINEWVILYTFSFGI